MLFSLLLTFLFAFVGCSNNNTNYDDQNNSPEPATVSYTLSSIGFYLDNFNQNNYSEIELGHGYVSFDGTILAGVESPFVTGVDSPLLFWRETPAPGVNTTQVHLESNPLTFLATKNINKTFSSSRTYEFILYYSATATPLTGNAFGKTSSKTLQISPSSTKQVFTVWTANDITLKMEIKFTVVG